MANKYTDCPLSGNTLAADQPSMEADFAYLVNTLGIAASATKDHQLSYWSGGPGGIDTNTFEGRHLRCSLKAQASNLAHSGDGTDTMLYSSSGDLWANNGVNAQLQLTNLAFSAKNTPAAAGATCYSSLPGALFVQFGFISPPTHQVDTAVTFVGLGGKSFNSCFGVWTAPQRSGSNNVDVVYTSSVSGAGFTYHNTSSSGITGFSWLALGQ